MFDVGVGVVVIVVVWAAMRGGSLVSEWVGEWAWATARAVRFFASRLAAGLPQPGIGNWPALAPPHQASVI
jgi:hypothetical protein